MSVPIKTPEGQAELDRRSRGLSQRQRTVLLLVDGRRSAEEVRRLAAQAGAPAEAFDELLRLKLIRLRAPQCGAEAEPDSELPAARSLYPDSTLTDSMLRDLPSADSVWGQAAPEAAPEEVRTLLGQALRAHVPLAGSITLLRLRRARTRAELQILLAEVEARLAKSHKLAAAEPALRRARELLGAPNPV